MSPPLHNAGYGTTKLYIPEGLPVLLENLSREVLRHQPLNIIQFAADHFSNLLEARKIAENASSMLQDKFLWQMKGNKYQDESETMQKNLENNAALTIQKNFKGYLERKKFNQQKNAINVIKRKYHQHYLHRSQSALKIQTHYQNYKRHKSFMTEKEIMNQSKTQNLEDSAIKIQAVFRGYQARKNYKNRKDSVEKEVKENSDDVEKAAIVIQKNLKGYLTRKKLRSHASV